MSTTTPRRMWFRIIAEGVVVVMSILVAFGIDAWWERKGLLDQETRVLRSVMVELRRNADQIAEFTLLHEEQRERINVLLAMVSDDHVEISSDSIDHLLAGLLVATVSVYERGALDDALRSLDILGNFSVRQRLATWERMLQQLTEVEGEEARLVRDAWLPAMRELADLRQLSSAGRAGALGKGRSQGPLPRMRSHAQLLDDREFVNLMVQRQWVHQDIIREHVRVQAFLRGLVMQLGS